ncbi:hypothetical protein BV22DRAFT_1193300 [Leucogyrophana mollusca]|uniref:Uncharacterized protein n=1 Tax=Leucogyrophana mollusca TaxID=85980 RepID=A0ACB8BSR3_9AGAM|nr:hypothetical protein BV22DRAFT_1193300 [Leucogyrophana mollusca]
MSDHEQGHENLTDLKPRPYSIDLTLELERQLDNESLPPTSPTDATGRPHSLDPHVLASIITQLRSSLVDVSRERDDLAQTLSETRAREAGLTDTLNHMTDKYTRMEEELETAKAKSKDDEDAIAMLRTKVEESRRGLMRLQSESRRMSQTPSALDMSRAGIPSLGAPPSSKRSSFAPLTGSAAGRVNSHRRISSVATVSDTSFSLLDGGIHLSSPNPQTPSFTFPDASMSKNSRRMSGMFGRASPPASLYTTEESAELENLRQELNSMRVELDIAKHELGESNEAREASEMCVKALREFIAENNVGEQPPRPPPRLPSLSMTSSSQSEAEAKKGAAAAAGGWGFKLWRADTTVKSPAAPSPAVASPIPVPAASAAPLTKKLGGFFTSRGSVSSVTSPIPRPIEQEPMYNGMSDVSSIEESVVEPVSPASELARSNVMVRDGSTTSSRDMGSPEQVKVQHLASPLALESSLPSLAT